MADYSLGVYIGDLHGNYGALEWLLDELQKEYQIFSDRASGRYRPNVRVVQCGDRIDRDDQGKRIIEECMRLDAANDGQSGQVFGNHELLALACLDHAKLSAGSDDPEGSYRWSMHGYNGGLPFVLEFGASGDSSKVAFEKYVAAMHASAPMGRWMRGLKPFDVMCVGDKRVLAVHGGIPSSITHPFDILEYISNFGDHMRKGTDTFGGSEKKFNHRLVDEHSVFWDRSIPAGDLRAAEKLLDNLQIDFLVIGHTPQKDGKIGRYGSRIFNVDIAMADAYGGNDPGAVVVSDKGVRAFYVTGGEADPVKRKERFF
ncbi:MAG: metallophosphoesterase [Nanoarchaeota archaeon]|nr:metallophosphoesterase [Nanoarchaeota archaeon]